MLIKKCVLCFILLVVYSGNLQATVYAGGSDTSGFDPNIKNAAFEVVIPNGIRVIQEEISPNASDPSIIFRITAIATNSWFDAIAPYHPTAVGVYSTIPRRPHNERTDRNRNIAVLYASFRTLSALIPERLSTWRKMLLDVGLDPDDNSQDPNSPIGVGNLAGFAIVHARMNDGMNQLGKRGGCQYNCTPYEDYTGYKPKNSAHKLKFPSRWQPKSNAKGGIFTVQQFVTPQLEFVVPYTYGDPRHFIAPFPAASHVTNYWAYKHQADQVIDASAQLTDEQKMKAEFFDNKFKSVFAAAASVIPLLDLTVEESIILDFATNLASFDTSIAIWHNKRKYDAVRPFSAINYLYGKHHVTAWGGPNQGTVTDLRASDWESYLPVANHPEYPSATASFCSAHAQVMRRLHGEDNLEFAYPVQAGESRIEPGFTPKMNMVLNWNNWSDFEYDCGESRLWAGVHFPASIPAGQDIGREIADLTYEYIQSLLSGHRPHIVHTYKFKKRKRHPFPWYDWFSVF